MIYRIIDIFFVVFHSSIVLFNLFGWIWKKTRKFNLILLLLTISSWLFLGLIVGTPGYCPLTDWHFRVLNKLGVYDLPSSYVKYLADRITGIDFNSALIDTVTLYTTISALALSVFFNVKDFFARRRASSI